MKTKRLALSLMKWFQTEEGVSFFNHLDYCVSNFEKSSLDYIEQMEDMEQTFVEVLEELHRE